MFDFWNQTGMGLISVDGVVSDTMALSALAPPELSAQDVHIWFANFGPDDIPATDFGEFLDAVEQARAARFVFAHHRERFMRAHGVLRLVLARYAGRPAAELAFAVDRYGKPELVDVEGVAFSLSHSANGVAIAVTSGRSVGLDIELPHGETDRDDFVRRFFSPSEIEGYFATEVPRREQVFFRLWTRKEAFLKGLGLGLSRPLDSFSVGISIPVTLQAPQDGPWSLRHLDFSDNFVGAVACSQGSPDLHGWQISLDSI